MSSGSEAGKYCRVHKEREKSSHLIGIKMKVTNDGWWGDTPGYNQHLRYASLRAIETRRSIARSANTGISALIDQRGVIKESLGWWQRGYVKGELNLNSKITTFVKYGDYIGRVAYASMLLFVGLFLLIVLKIYGKERG